MGVGMNLPNKISNFEDLVPNLEQQIKDNPITAKQWLKDHCVDKSLLTSTALCFFEEAIAQGSLIVCQFLHENLSVLQTNATDNIECFKALFQSKNIDVFNYLWKNKVVQEREVLDRIPRLCGWVDHSTMMDLFNHVNAKERSNHFFVSAFWHAAIEQNPDENVFQELFHLIDRNDQHLQSTIKVLDFTERFTKKISENQKELSNFTLLYYSKMEQMVLQEALDNSFESEDVAPTRVRKL